MRTTRSPRRRPRPLLIAPVIPFLALVGILGIERLQGTHLLVAFVVVWCLLMVGLFAYVLRQALGVRRRRRTTL